MKRTIAITLGDPSGIGPEVVAKTLHDPRLPKGFDYVVLGEENGRGIQTGKPSIAAARVALKALNAAARGCLDGTYAAMVTGPVSKSMLARVQPDFVGQTEFLARACGLKDDAAVMGLTDPKLTVVLCSNHCALRAALAALKVERIVHVAKVTRAFLQRRGIAKPRLALAGVNPHLGEVGGDEDQRIVAPACAQLRREKIDVIHAPADTVFHHAVQRKAFDAVICAYHDQGLIPFKMVAFATGVNVTLGLPIIRTSPDHGTAHGIAGQNEADPRSMQAAVRLACKLAR